jgi:hypothetical protein
LAGARVIAADNSLASAVNRSISIRALSARARRTGDDLEVMRVAARGICDIDLKKRRQDRRTTKHREKSNRSLIGVIAKKMLQVEELSSAQAIGIQPIAMI